MEEDDIRDIQRHDTRNDNYTKMKKGDKKWKIKVLSEWSENSRGETKQRKQKEGEWRKLLNPSHKEKKRLSCGRYEYIKWRKLDK